MNSHPAGNMERSAPIHEIEPQQTIEQFLGEFAMAAVVANPQDPEGYETARRNFFIGVLLYAQETRDSTEKPAAALNRVSTEALRVAAEAHVLPASVVSHDSKFWRIRNRRLSAAIDSQPRTPLPTNIELLQSLKLADRKYWHNLTRYVP